MTVEFPPGCADPIHHHNASVFVYVLKGAVPMQLEGKPSVTLRPGQTFYEAPIDVPFVGRNVSQTKPAKFLAFFVKDKGLPLVLPVQ